MALSFFRNQKVLNFVLQAGFLGVVLMLLISAVYIGQTNMAAQGLTGGFGFLEQSTGWRINFTLIDYDIKDSYARALWVGAINTMFLGAITLTLATIVGLLAGAARLSSNKLAATLGGVFVDIFRNVPLVLQALFWYAVLTHLPNAKNAINPIDGIFISNRGAYFPGLNVSGGSAALAILTIVVAIAFALWISTSRKTSRMEPNARMRLWLGTLAIGTFLTIVILAIGRLPDTDLVSMPYLKGLNFREGIRLAPEFSAAVIGISLFGAAYIAEIFRAGLMSVKAGMGEAGAALGLSPLQVFFRSNLPLAFRSILPILTNQYVWLIKATTIGLAIGFNDFFMVISISINQSGQTISLILILIVAFWILNFSLAGVMNWINRKIAIKGEQN